MLIGLGSQSEVKQAAVAHALRELGLTADVISVKAASGISEQPFNEETITGAKNRAFHTAVLVPGADFTIAIESGLFKRSGCYFDVAIVLVRLPNGEFLQQESVGVVFPTDAVAEVQRRGPALWTVGKILQESGRVRWHNDPHLCLVGRSRSDYINDAVVQLFQTLRDRKLL